MLEIGANVARDCNRWGMPLLIMSYPRGKGIDSFSAQSVGHAVRVAEELGADMIKTNYPGSPEAFGKIVKACSVPVFIAGGEKTGDLESLQIIRDAVKVGGAGVCVGRNSFQREDTTAFVKALCAVVHDEVDPEKALGKKR
jgi:fructose-bisphosphate aldolase/2-amino-3,7-dideoxy-D-threo-hept-6-ulosonate synthase